MQKWRNYVIRLTQRNIRIDLSNFILAFNFLQPKTSFASSLLIVDSVEPECSSMLQNDGKWRFHLRGGVKGLFIVENNDYSTVNFTVERYKYNKIDSNANFVINYF